MKATRIKSKVSKEAGGMKSHKTLFDSAEDMMCVHDMKGNFLEVNKNFCRKLGYSRKQLLSMKAGELALPDRREYFKMKMREIMKKGRAYWRGMLKRKDGSWIHLEFQAGKSKDGNKEVVYTLLRDITKEKEIENALKESERKYSALVEGSHDGIVIIQDDKVKYANSRMFEITGFAREEESKRPFLGFIAPEYRGVVRERYRKRLVGIKVPKRYEAAIISKEGVNVPVEISASIIEYKGKPADMVVMRDITERKKYEEKIKNSEERYRGLIESQDDLIVRVDPEGRFTFVNDAYCRKFGKKKSELLGKTFMPLVHKEDLPATLKAMEGLKVPPYRIQVDQRAKTAKGWRWIAWEDYAIRDEKGKLIEIQAVGRDITESKRSRIELKKVRDHLQTVLDGIDEAIVVIDRKYRIVSHNKKFMSSLKKKKKSIIGDNCHEVIHEFRKPCSSCVVRKAFKTGRPWHDTHYHIEKTGKMYHEVKAYPIKDPSGTIKQCVYIFRDVTERETMYDKIKEANAKLNELNKMKSDFISIASHELKTPLAIIKGYVDVLDSNMLGQLNEKQESKIQAIGNKIVHLNSLIDNILDLSVIDSGMMRLNLREILLEDLAFEVVRDFKPIAEVKEIEMQVKTDSIPTKTVADQERIRQVLMNLVGNAIKFTPNKGIVRVIVTKDEKHAILRVEDTGIGIPKRDLSKVFDRFYQVDSTSKRRYPGVGLGLAVCKDIVKLHKGEIKIKSWVNKGTVVNIKIPLKHQF